MPRQWKWDRLWDGGRVRITSTGREVFVIERKGRTVALDVRSERDARVQLALFLEDPAGYQTPRKRGAERARRAALGAVRLDAATLAEFEVHCEQREARGELTASHRKHTLVPYLRAWAKALAGRDLRDVTLADLVSIQKQWPTAEHKRIVALKTFTAWARKVGKLARKDDPTLDLSGPPIKAARPVEERAFSSEEAEAFYAALTNYSFAVGYAKEAEAPEGADRATVDLQPIRDVFVLRLKAGLHHTEIDRLARGDGKIRVLVGEGEIAGVLRFPHKRGEEHSVSVDAQTLAAAQRLQKRGEAPNRVATSRAVARVVAAHPELKGFSFERLRHTCITLGAGGRVVMPKGGSVPLEVLAQLVGHTTGTRTTRRHYLGTIIPPMVVIPVRLVNSDDSIPVPD